MKVIWIILSIAFILLAWYLFFRPYEFEVKFKAKTLPGDLIETVRIWDRSLTNAEIIKVDSFNSLRQHFNKDNNKYIYFWNFEILNDSTTQVNIKISQPGQSITNKLLIPFTSQPIEQDAKEIVNSFYTIMKTHLEKTSVSIVGESELAPTFCVCSSLETEQTQKAFGMMKDYGLLVSFIGDHNLETDGPPMVKVNEWNHSLGTLNFDFCFPIKKRDSLPEYHLLFYKNFEREKVLKAIYHGNYITSDRAWYAIIKYAETEGYELKGAPIEYFHNNPNLGVGESEWKAEVHIPVK